MTIDEFENLYKKAFEIDLSAPLTKGDFIDFSNLGSDEVHCLDATEVEYAKACNEMVPKLIKLARAVDEIDDSTLCDLGLYFLREEVFGDDA